MLQDERFILVVDVNIINLKTETETTSETSRILNNEHVWNSEQCVTQLRSMPIESEAIVRSLERITARFVATFLHWTYCAREEKIAEVLQVFFTGT